MQALNREAHAWAAREADGAGGEDPNLRARVDYERYCAISATLSAPLQRHLGPRTFLKLRRDKHGRISVAELMDLVMRRNDIRSWRLELSRYDADGRGRLTEGQLEQFFNEICPRFAVLQQQLDVRNPPVSASASRA